MSNPTVAPTPLHIRAQREADFQRELAQECLAEAKEACPVFKGLIECYETAIRIVIPGASSMYVNSKAALNAYNDLKNSPAMRCWETESRLLNECHRRTQKVFADELALYRLQVSIMRENLLMSMLKCHSSEKKLADKDAMAAMDRLLSYLATQVSE